MKIEELAILAMETSSDIDWSVVKFDRYEAHRMMAEQVIGQLDKLENEQIVVVLAASMTKLLVENFVLKLKLKEIS
jgi:hypothetical protein|tara:strand:+ start:52 stop:279 length:228 start_codon:yes stop_codon:yes gene_type:complete